MLQTFPHIADQLRYVYYGTEGYNAEGIDVYGNPDREGGAHVTGERGVMPAFGEQLTGAEIVAVVCHERYTIGGADPTSEEFADEYEAWCSPESPIFEGLEAGDVRRSTTRSTPRCSTPRASRSTPASSARCRHPPATADPPRSAD